MAAVVMWKRISPVESDRDDLSVAGVQPFIEEKELEVLEKRHSDLWLNEKRANNLEDSVMQAAEKSSWTFGEVYCTMLMACMSGTWIVLNRRWLKDVEKFLTFRTTSQLESFQNHILIALASTSYRETGPGRI
uniref:Uncharacterized protein n=1 Tax=Knipowitschia caucasica TaxID=637954 RepID=A0AAV2KLX1_KNICA